MVFVSFFFASRYPIAPAPFDERVFTFIILHSQMGEWGWSGEGEREKE